MIRELSVQEQKYHAVLAVLVEGRSVAEVAAQWGVSRQSVHAWLRRDEEAGLPGLVLRSTRPGSCPHQMPGSVPHRQPPTAGSSTAPGMTPAVGT